MNRWLLVLAVLASFAFAAPSAHAQGWDTIKKPRYGLKYRVPRDYHPIPASPLEKHIVLIYEEDPPGPNDEFKKVTPRVNIVILDHSEGVATPTTGGDEDAPEEEGEEVPQGPPAINSVNAFVEYRMTDWEIGEVEEGKPVDGYKFKRYELIGKQERRGVVFAYSNPTRTVAFLGIAHRDDIDDETGTWEDMVKQLDISEPDLEKYLKERAVHERFYERKKKYLDPEFRIETRMELPDGWEAEDTENYILVYSTKDQPLIRLVARELEAMRTEYERLFPPLEPVTAVSRVRICKDRDEYMAYGGPPNSGGYWNSAEEELVFYDYENLDGEAGTGKANSRIVLYHEAFHQFIYYSAGSFAPHSWYNEGTGDYFSGAKLRGSKVLKIDVNPWRIETIQKMIERSQYAPLDEIVNWEQRAYYGQNEYGLPGGMLYAQGWSMVYFMRESKDVRKHPTWSKILDVYFETLRSTFREGMLELEEKGLADSWPAKAELGYNCRQKASEAAFDDVDFDEFEEAWKEFVMDLKVPR